MPELLRITWWKTWRKWLMKCSSCVWRLKTPRRSSLKILIRCRRQ
jgi:hypothetical protein